MQAFTGNWEQYMEIWTGYLRSKTVLYHNAHKIHTAFLSFSNRRSLGVRRRALFRLILGIGVPQKL